MIIAMTNSPIALEAYEKLADAYASKIDTKPHNAYYDRPAMLSMLPDVRGKEVLDAGCGPGVYAEELVRRGARVIACDISDRMLEIARNRLQETAIVKKVDLSQRLDEFDDNEFDLVNAPLCADYVEDWNRLFSELFRILRPGGYFLFSCGHPSFDAQYFSTQKYFSVEYVECEWSGFDVKVTVPSYRRSIEEVMMPVIRAGFQIDRVHEPLPTDQFKAADLMRYKQLMHRPAFLCIGAVRP